MKYVDIAQTLKIRVRLSPQLYPDPTHRKSPVNLSYSIAAHTSFRLHEPSDNEYFYCGAFDIAISIFTIYL